MEDQVIPGIERTALRRIVILTGAGVSADSDSRIRTFRKLEGSSGHGDQQNLFEWGPKQADTVNATAIALMHCKTDRVHSFEQERKKQFGPVLIPGDHVDMSR